MTTADKAKKVVQMFRDQAAIAVMNTNRIRCDVTGETARLGEWDRQHTEDGIGGFGGNPYETHLKALRLRLVSAVDSQNQADEILTFVLEHFLGLIKDA